MIKDTTRNGRPAPNTRAEVSLMLGEAKLEQWKRAEKIAQIVTFESELLQKFAEFYGRVCQWVLGVLDPGQVGH